VTSIDSQERAFNQPTIDRTNESVGK